MAPHGPALGDAVVIIHAEIRHPLYYKVSVTAIYGVLMDYDGPKPAVSPGSLVHLAGRRWQTAQYTDNV